MNQFETLVGGRNEAPAPAPAAALARKIRDLCGLAGRPELADGLIAQECSAADVLNLLLAALAGYEIGECPMVRGCEKPAAASALETERTRRAL